MVKIQDTFVPNPENVELYQKMIPIYKDITVHTDEVLKKTYELFD